jgi:hypothetical protein
VHIIPNVDGQGYAGEPTQRSFTLLLLAFHGDPSSVWEDVIDVVYTYISCTQTHDTSRITHVVHHTWLSKHTQVKANGKAMPYAHVAPGWYKDSSWGYEVLRVLLPAASATTQWTVVVGV